MGNHEIDKKGDKQQIAMPHDYNCNNRDWTKILLFSSS